jgi:excisionase family DNA binding protein
MSTSGAWLRAAEVAARLQVSPKTVSRWAKQGRLAHRRTLGGHRRYDPDQIDQLVRALTYQPEPNP